MDCRTFGPVVDYFCAFNYLEHINSEDFLVILIFDKKPSSYINFLLIKKKKKLICRLVNGVFFFKPKYDLYVK